MKGKIKNFVHEIKFKFKLSILNENTLEEVWHIRLSRLNVLLFCFGVAVVYFFIVAVLLVKTPLNGFLPGYASQVGLRKEIVHDALTIDSMEAVLSKQEQYDKIVKGIISGDIPADSLSNIDTLVNKELAKISIEAGKKESEYNQNYEKEAKKQAFTANEGVIEDPISFKIFKPATGVVTNKYNPARDQYGVTLSLQAKSNIHAALSGTITSTGMTISQEYLLTVQHADNITTIYKCSQPFNKGQGDRVSAGESLTALTENAPVKFTFEIWENGTAKNPENYINF